MPSGAKKRKAAKKKKEKETITNPTSPNNSQGNDELKSRDDKGSDGGEGGSPTYDDDHHHPFNEGNEETEEGDPLAAQPSAADAKSAEEVPIDTKIGETVGREEDSAVLIERDLKPEENCESKDVNVVVRTESAKESIYENGNSGGSANVETVAGESSKDEADGSMEAAVTFDELVKSIDSSHAKMTSLSADAPVEEAGDSVKPAGSVSEANGSDENVRTSSLEVPKPKEFENIVLPPVSRSPLPESTNGTELVKDSDAPGSSQNQPLVASAPRMVQKTSWLNCCGLLEVLSGSNR